MKRVRILIDHPSDKGVLYANGTPDLPDALADELIAAGIADDSAEAVAYAESLGVAVPAFDADTPPKDADTPPKDADTPPKDADTSSKKKG